MADPRPWHPAEKKRMPAGRQHYRSDDFIPVHICNWAYSSFDGTVELFISSHRYSPDKIRFEYKIYPFNGHLKADLVSICLIRPVVSLILLSSAS